ncbi:MAG: HD domain-containing protein [Bdellovibrionia bacterium]
MTRGSIVRVPMTESDRESWERKFRVKAQELYPPDDPAHDLLHVQRVVNMAKKLSEVEGTQWEVVVPAAWFHDYVNVPKNDPRRSRASRLSAEAALSYLASISYPQEYFSQIAHSIEAHSFSAAIPTQTPEAAVVQDADRLDGLGAIGIARCFATSGVLKRPFYDELDPWAEKRDLDDRANTLDHFFQKLLKVAYSMGTEAGRTEGNRRVQVMKVFLESLRTELTAQSESSIQ